jgi:hypothetical protein
VEIKENNMNDDLDLDLWEMYGYTSIEDMESKKFARLRKAEYDALNQFELISDDAINGTTTHKDAIVAIKTKYPKV